MIPQGYKQTEVGLIPEEWDIKCTESFGDIITGSTPSTENERFWNGDIPWITPSDIQEERDIAKSERMITKEGLSAIRELPPSTLLVTCIASIGKNAVLTQKGACNQQINAIIPSNEYSVNYLYYLMEINKEYLLANSGITATRIVSKNDFAKLKFAVSTNKKEQEYIAEALSDVDNMISSLEKLITKKKAVKQGAMQELLTGKKRLPGFSGNIEYKTLSSMCAVFADGDWIESKDQSNDGIRLIQTGNIGSGKYLDKADKQRFISEDTFNRLKCLEIFENDVLVSRLPDPAGRACILPSSNKRRITAVDCTIIRFINYNPVLFVAYSQTKEYQDKVDTAMAGSTRQRISRKELGEILIPVFPSKEEQTAIASILSDMNAEIEALEQKLEKTRQIKQGMMQQLLTGKIRLV